MKVIRMTLRELCEGERKEAVPPTSSVKDCEIHTPSMSQAWNNGYMSYFDEKTYKDNPYPHMSKEYVDWEYGMDAAETALMIENEELRTRTT